MPPSPSTRTAPTRTAVINVSDSFTGTDLDRDAQAITYSITAGNTGGAFAINAATGAITVANSGALDFETTPSFTLTVTASDGTLSDTAAITVNLNNLNDNAPNIVDATVAIDENSANATAVINVSDSFTDDRLRPRRPGDHLQHHGRQRPRRASPSTLQPVPSRWPTARRWTSRRRRALP